MKLTAKLLLISAFAAGCALCGQAAGAPDDPASIVEEINMAHGSVVVSQPASLDSITGHASAAYAEDVPTSGRLYGYRVQVFSDNNIRTAKSNAEYRKRSVEQAMPGVRAYLTFESPYWRVRVGDYRTYGEADEAMHQIMQMFPAFASDVKIIKERINARKTSHSEL